MNIQENIYYNKEIVKQMQSQLKPLYYFHICEEDISDEIYDNIRESSYDTEKQLETPYMEFGGVECHVTYDYNPEGYEWLIFTVSSLEDAKELMKYLGVEQTTNKRGRCHPNIYTHYIKYSL